MDGNGRWATRRGLPRIAGHEAGARAVRMAVESCREMGVKFLTLYAFSQENWLRPTDEVRALWKLLARYLREELARLRRHEIRLQTIGRPDRLPAPAQKELDKVIEATSSYKAMTLTLALSYSGRDEIVAAARSMARKAVAGELDVDSIDEGVFTQHLYAPDLPDPDLLIRTSGEMRLSNFLLWQVAYSELYITDTYWPDFNRAELVKAVEVYNTRERRFGKVSGE